MAQRAALVDQLFQRQNLNQVTSQQSVHFVLFVSQPREKMSQHKLHNYPVNNYFSIFPRQLPGAPLPPLYMKLDHTWNVLCNMYEVEYIYTNIGFPATLGCFSRSSRASSTSFILCLSLESTTKMIPCASPQSSLQAPLDSTDPPTSNKVTR